MDGGAVEGGVIDISNVCSKYMHLEPGDSVWDECGLYRLKKCPFCGNYPDWNYEEDVTLASFADKLLLVVFHSPS